MLKKVTVRLALVCIGATQQQTRSIDERRMRTELERLHSNFPDLEYGVIFCFDLLVLLTRTSVGCCGGGGGGAHKRKVLSLTVPQRREQLLHACEHLIKWARKQRSQERRQWRGVAETHACLCGRDVAHGLQEIGACGLNLCWIDEQLLTGLVNLRVSPDIREFSKLVKCANQFCLHRPNVFAQGQIFYYGLSGKW